MEHFDKAVDVPVISSPLLLDIFINFGIQFGRVNAAFFRQALPLGHGDEVWVMTTTYWSAELRMRSRMGEVSDLVFRPFF